MPKNLSPLPQITPPPTLSSNDALLTDISAFKGLNPREALAARVYFRMKELANDASAPLTNYDPSVPGNITALFQDSKTVFGSIPVGDLPYASLAIDWANSKAVYGALPSEVDAIRALLGNLVTRTDDELQRAAMYLRLEIGE
jgi:hypothetical protein